MFFLLEWFFKIVSWIFLVFLPATMELIAFGIFFLAIALLLFMGLYPEG